MRDERSEQGARDTEFEGAIADVELTEGQKQFLRGRWLDQMRWMEARANQARGRYFALRSVTVLGSALVPALVSLQLGLACGQRPVRWAAFGLSIVVALAAGTEGLFNFGERWRLYRQGTEALKVEGWRFLALTGGYRRFRDHAAAYPTFSERVETVLEGNVAGFFDRVAPSEYGRPARANGGT